MAKKATTVATTEERKRATVAAAASDAWALERLKELREREDSTEAGLAALGELLHVPVKRAPRKKTPAAS